MQPNFKLPLLILSISPPPFHSAGHRWRMDHIGHLLVAEIHLRAHSHDVQLRDDGDDVRPKSSNIQFGSIRHDQLWLPLRHSAASHDGKYIS